MVYLKETFTKITHSGLQIGLASPHVGIHCVSQYSSFVLSMRLVTKGWGSALALKCFASLLIY